MSYKYCASFVVVVACLLSASCGNHQKLKGKVTFPDGQPLTTGTVVFSKSGFVSRSFVLPDGSFNVGSVKDGDGIPPGKYKVYIIEALESVHPDDPTSDAMRPVIDAKFMSSETSPLEIEIPGNKTFDIVVERPIPLKKKR